MPVAKLRAISTSDVMKSDERNDSVDTFVRQATGREPFLSFPRTGDNPVQWIQLLHALDQPDLTGWPLPSPSKVQMQKCDKCSREFCSPINYRRHIRVHRRSLNVDKESHKNRDLLGAFWDKLSLDEAREIVSFKDVNLEEVPGSSIIRELTSFIQKPRFVTLPQVYVKAGSALLDIIQVRPSRLPIASQELFSILDDASERTFLCAGTAESMQKYVFDGEAGKIGLETKNLVACTSFLVEQKLVKAWVADKDAEALRCQKLLVEEEEAAQKRQAELLEKRRQKKLRQKEQKLKEQANGEKAYLEDNQSDALDSPPAEISSGPAASESGSNILETLTEHASSFLEPLQHLVPEEDADIVAQFGYCSDHADSGASMNVECQTVQGIGRRHLAISRWQVPKSQKGRWNGFHAGQNPQLLKLEPAQKHGALKDSKAAPVVNGNKVWTRKPKPENEGESIISRVDKEAVHQAEQNKNSEVMIGSIPVMLGNSTARQQGDSLVEAQQNCGTEHASSETSEQEKPTKTDSHVHGGLNRSTVMLWRPVSRHETRGPKPIQNACGESRDAIIGKDNYYTVASETFIGSCALDDNYERPMDESLLFSTHAAKAFLAERWKEAISEDHVKVVISPESEPPRCPEAENDCQVLATSSDSQPQGICGYDSSSAMGTVYPVGTKPEKGLKMKYIPKQRTVTPEAG